MSLQTAYPDELDKWDRRFLDMAQMVASWSKDPNTQMGAVLVSTDRRHISCGYNGFPRGVKDDLRLNKRDLKRQLCEHSERNAIYNCPWDPHRITTTIYVTGNPCLDCAKAIIQSGISSVVALSYDFLPRWKENMELAQALMLEAGLNMTLVEERNHEGPSAA
jgi:dCMP deaminase